jgi:hypothetical protein
MVSFRWFVPKATSGGGGPGGFSNGKIKPRKNAGIFTLLRSLIAGFGLFRPLRFHARSLNFE